MQLPEFFKRQVLVKAAPGEKIVPSGTLTSVTKDALSQLDGAMVGGGGMSGVAVAVNAGSGVRVEGGAGGCVGPTRTMRGDPHTARSPLASPVESNMKTNLTFCPASELKSRFAR